MADYIPRTTKDGIYGAKYWYTRTNPFYPPYQLPNCTCYAWGRFWEISPDHVPKLPTGNAGTWFANAKARGYKTGSTPALGAVACFGKRGAAGHVAIVEEIYSNGDIRCSNSGYYRPVSTTNWHYFFMTTNKKNNNYVPWNGYYFQGFIYNPYAGDTPSPVDPPDPDPPIPNDPDFRKKHLPFIYYLKKL